MSEDYVRTARAKGLPERTIILRHGLRAALTPVVTLIGLDAGLLLGGVVVPANIVVDVLYAVIDPRVRY
jgi:peptide/nickel transport system permease protein